MPSPKELYDFYISQGLQPHQAAAMTAHAQAESGINPTASHDQGTGFGIYGFRDPTPGKGRWTDLKNYAESGTGEKLDVNDWRTQARFALRELDTTEKAAGAKLYGAQDYGQAVDAGMHYLRPAGYTADNPQGGHNYAGRFNAGLPFVPGQQPIMGPAVAAAGGSQVPQGGLLAPQGIDAEIAQWSGMEPPGGRAALDKVVAADAAQKSATNALMAAGQKVGGEMIAAGAPKQSQWQNLQASVHQPQQQVQLPDFNQQLAQSRLRRKPPWEDM